MSIVTAPPYATMSLAELEIDLAGWTRMLATAARFNGATDLIAAKWAECAAEIKRRQATEVAA